MKSYIKTLESHTKYLDEDKKRQIDGLLSFRPQLSYSPARKSQHRKSHSSQNPKNLNQTLKNEKSTDMRQQQRENHNNTIQNLTLNQSMLLHSMAGKQIEEASNEDESQLKDSQQRLTNRLSGRGTNKYLEHEEGGETENRYGETVI